MRLLVPICANPRPVPTKSPNQLPNLIPEIGVYWPAAIFRKDCSESMQLAGYQRRLRPVAERFSLANFIWIVYKRFSSEIAKKLN